MKIIQTVFLTLEQKKVLYNLWNSEYPEKLVYDNFFEFENYLQGLSKIKHFLLVDNKDELKGWSFVFEIENENWFGLIINSEIQKNGYGTLLLNELKNHKSVLNGWVIDHQNDIKNNNRAYLSPIEFYLKNGFVICPNSRLDNTKISAVKINWTLYN
jgi:hypothetical protein